MKKLHCFWTLILAFSAIFSHEMMAQATSGKRPQLIFYRHNSNPSGATPVVSGDTTGSILFRGLLANNPTSIVTGAAIRSITTGALSAGVMPSNLLFQTSSAGTLNNRMIITPEGLVGIGTINPLYHLHTVGNTHTSGRFFGRIHFDVGEPTDLPSTYIDEAYFERKSRAQLGLGANAFANGGILTLAPGGGGLDRQLFSGGSDGLWTRSQDAAAGGNTWDAWHKILTSSDINGNVGRLSRFTGANAGDPSSTLGNSQLFDNGTNVGIATTTPDPAFRFHVVGNTKFEGNTTAQNGTFSNALTVQETSRFVGKVAIGSDPISTPGSHALYVGGSIIAEEVVVKLRPNWPDYVFAPDYNLQPLSEVAVCIEEENHLPGVPSAEAIATNGLSVGAMQKIQMEKIEEIYLHLIALEKQVQILQAENAQLKKAQR